MKILFSHILLPKFTVYSSIKKILLSNPIRKKTFLHRASLLSAGDLTIVKTRKLHFFNT